MSDRFNSPIVPTVGRIVLVRGCLVLPSDPTRDVPAIISQVWGPNCIDVTVFKPGQAGVLQLTSVIFDGGDEHTAIAAIDTGWRWMPYQLAKAAEIVPGSEGIASAEGTGDQTSHNVAVPNGPAGLIQGELSLDYAQAEAVADANANIAAGRDAMTGEPVSFFDRVKEEAQELQAKWVKLTSFLSTDLFRSLVAKERELLIQQHKHMQSYLSVLHLRLDHLAETAR